MLYIISYKASKTLTGRYDGQGRTRGVSQGLQKYYFEGALTNVLSNGHKIVLLTTENWSLSLILSISMNLIN